MDPKDGSDRTTEKLSLISGAKNYGSYRSCPDYKSQTK
jgi:hypothetical protein